ncbi:MAG: hypothetical protein HGB15_01225 [Chlorobaculum sp.]|jgi:hypothetical protein|nr:hypothetical protein [Chlorobaculum sp.]
MKQDEAKREIKKLRIEKGKPKAEFQEAMDFYNYLVKNHPNLLSFRSRNVDKYQIIKGFIHSFE